MIWSAAWLGPLLYPSVAALALDYTVNLTRARQGYDGIHCWVHARAGAIPVGAAGNPVNPIIVMTMSKMLMQGSDVFYALHDLRSDDLGESWEGPRLHETLGRHPFPDGGEIVVSDFWPRWHARSARLLGIGHTVRYVDNHVVAAKNPRSTAYSVYDPQARSWAAWKTLEVPANSTLASSGAGSTGRFDLPNGDILLPVYSNPVRDGKPLPAAASVLRCRFDGVTLRLVEQGNELSVPTGRGFGEPSLARFQGRYFLTLRNDDYLAVSRGQDGLHYEAPRTVKFDDGRDLGSYNTQSHWVAHSDALFLVYTRKGASNDHVFRHRAPLFIAEFDPDRMVVRRATERILVPQRGARLGNFGVTVVNEHETWVTVTEWMQTWGPNYVMPVNNQWGADNSVYVARIRWAKPNRAARP